MSSIIKDNDGPAASEWDYIVKVVLVDGSNLLAMDDNGLSDPYVRFRLQNEKYKTKVWDKGFVYISLLFNRAGLSATQSYGLGLIMF